MNRKALPKDWSYTIREESEFLWMELQRELSPEHILFHEPIQVIARSSINDDILCRHSKDVNQYIVVHLTWSTKVEMNSEFPFVEMDGRFEDFLAYAKN